jgi:peptidoglycan/xylan/chitin deacetylase (PgdA/CDA1 family)
MAYSQLVRRVSILAAALTLIISVNIIVAQNSPPLIPFSHLLNATNQTRLNSSYYPPIDKVPVMLPEWGKFIGLNVKNSTSTSFLKWLRNPVDITHCNHRNDWALSYDDGCGPYTMDVLDALAKYNISATFFVVGSRIIECPHILAEQYRRGHQIAIHTWSHPSLIQLSNDQVVAELLWTAKIVYDVIGVIPTMIRPPCK